MLTAGAPRRSGRTVWPRGSAGVAAIGAAALAAAVSFAGIGSHALWTPDEPRDAAIGKAMWESGDLVVPRLNGQPFLEKPPLAWWAQAAAFQVLGASDAAARVPSAVAGTLTLLIAWGLGRRLGGARAGWLAAAALACTAQFGEDMRRAIVDPPLVLAVTAAWAGFVLLITPPGLDGASAGGAGVAAGGRRLSGATWAASLLIAAAVPLAFLVKGPVGLGLALGPPVLYLLASAVAGGRGGPAGSRRGLAATLRLLVPVAVLGAPLFAAVAVPWALALLHAAGGPALRETLVGNTVGRVLATEAGRAYGHRQPFWYYLPAGALAVLPWTLAVPALLRGGGGAGARSRPAGRGAGAEPAFTAQHAVEPRVTHQAGAAPTASTAGSGAPPVRPEPVPGPAAPSLTAEHAADGRRLLLASFFIGVGLFSLAASKRSLYLVPLLPGLAVPVGLWLDRLDREKDADSRWDRPSALLLLGLAALLLPLLWLGGWAAARGLIHSFPVAPLRAQLTAGRLAVAGALAAAAAGLLLHRWLRHLRGGTTPSGAWLVVPWLALALLYQTAVKTVIDPLKYPHDLTAAIARLDPGPGPVIAYRPSETTLGIIGFDLDREVLPLATPSEVIDFFAERPGGRLVLSLDALRHLPPELRARLRLLYDETSTKASPFVIAGCGASGAR